MSGDLYISVDIEADGPVPGEYSMLSWGAAAVAFQSGRTFERISRPPTFYTGGIRPTTENYVPEAVKVVAEGGLDRRELELSGWDPRDAMATALDWVRTLKKQFLARPVFVAYPLGFDWMFSHYYFERFVGVGMDPFGFSSALDVKSLYAAKARCTLDQAVKRKMPKELTDYEHHHTHNALDDALEQGELFCRVWEL